MQIKGRADTRPEIDREHDGQISPLKVRPEGNQAKNLQADQHEEEEQINFVVLKHDGAKWDATRSASETKSTPNILIERMTPQSRFLRR